MLQVQPVGYCSPRCSMPWSPTALLQRRRPQTQWHVRWCCCAAPTVRSREGTRWELSPMRVLWSGAICGGWWLLPGMSSRWGTDGIFWTRRFLQNVTKNVSLPQLQVRLPLNAAVHVTSVLLLITLWAVSTVALRATCRCFWWTTSVLLGSRQGSFKSHICFPAKACQFGAGDVCHHSHLRNSGSKTPYRKYLQYQQVSSSSSNPAMDMLRCGGTCRCWHWASEALQLLSPCCVHGSGPEKPGTRNVSWKNSTASCGMLGPGATDFFWEVTC